MAAVEQQQDYSESEPGKFKPTYWSHWRLKQSYLDYLSAKTDEINEQKDARRYRHGSQYTQEQIAIYNRRRQPVVTFNHIGPKINGVIGLIERLKQSPKGYPRTPKEEGGAAVATAAVRYVLDTARWKELAALVGEDAAVDGFGGIELMIDQGDQGDPDITFERVQPDSFFYDPRSYELDFSDARFLGQAKWLDLEQAKDMFPKYADELQDAVESATDLTTNADREEKWFISDVNVKRIRIVDAWYRMGGEWCWCIFTGNMKLDEGKSYFIDEKKRTVCKYLMFSAAVDQDGDRYGFVRQFKSPQDEINQRRSKGLHLLNTRRLISEKGAFDDIEKTRIEATRPDGVVEYNKGFEANFDDEVRLKESEGQIKFLQEAKAELDSYGPTLSLIGETGVQLSGRAISLQQQAGVAQLGPFILSNRAWKLRVYRAVWNAVRQYWKAERWIRVTDDENSIQFLGLNQLGTNPMTGMPAMVNQVSALDVDIIMDEGPDSINVMQDTYDAMVAIVQAGGQVPPDIIIELAPGIDPETRRRLLERLRAPNPAQQQAQQLELAKLAAETKDKEASAGLKQAQTMDTLRGDQGGPQEHPAITMANLQKTVADTDHVKAQTLKTMQEAMLAPQEMQMDQQKMAMDQHNAEADRQQNAYESERDASQSAYESERDKPANDPKLELELRKLAMEERRMEMEREERQKDRDHQERVKASELDYKADSEGFQRKKHEESRAKAEQQNQAFASLASKLVSTVEKIDNKLDVLESKVEAVSADLSAPAEIVRDKKTGRASHVKKGKRTMTVQRDKDGRATGVA